MDIKKAANSFNEYSMKISYGELKELIGALERHHSGPIADELYKGLKWYFERLPVPGSDETKLIPPDEKEEGGENLDDEFPTEDLGEPGPDGLGDDEDDDGGIEEIDFSDADGILDAPPED